MMSAFFFCASSISWEKLRRSGICPDIINILFEEMPSSIATGSTVERSFSSIKRHVAFDSFSTCFNSKGFDSAEIGANGVVM